MGQLIDGVWHDTVRYQINRGKFQRSASAFRNWLTADGAPAQPVRLALLPKKIAIICTFRWPVRGRIAR